MSLRTLLDFGHILEGAPYPVVLGATTAVAELLFPDRYQGQLAVRNSLRTTAINNAAHSACSSLATCRRVDLFALTFAAVDLPGSYNPGDPLHPTWPLSSPAAALVLDAFSIADEPDDVTNLVTHSSFILQS